ncbi:MAG: phosphoglycerate mutase family protein [Candidatus Woesearchaeota archaeon]|nr:phosphoglycerate mutase family protein [Candidatus Woesearchaeota archaeon]
MKHFFVVRHGSYHSHGREDVLSPLGHEQMMTLGRFIKDILHGSSAYICSSPAPRAVQSAQILGNALSLPSSSLEEIPYLWSGSDVPNDNPGYAAIFGQKDLMALVEERKEKADGLIMVTHFEVVRDLPHCFMDQAFQQKVKIPEVGKGQAVHINLERRTYQIIP